MKKREKKLQLNRETVLQLDNDGLKQAHGGVVSSCMTTDCCGGADVFQGQRLD